MVWRWLIVLLLSFPLRVTAHVLGRSFTDLRPSTDGVSVIVDFDPDDLSATLRDRFDTNVSGYVEPEELQAAIPALRSIVSSGWRVSRGGTPCAVEVRDARPDQSMTLLRVVMWFACSEPGAVRLDAPALEQFRRGHVNLLSVRLPSGAASAVLRQDAPTWAEPEVVSWWQTTASYVVLGVEHILIGFDHLLFLFGLVAVALHWRQLVVVVTAFTLAHSITLGMAVLGVFTLPDRFVEPAIALTIVYVGLENLLVAQPRWRWLLTFVFGLVHGFGFAGVLRETGLPANQRGFALLGFNLGVELGQLAAVALVSLLLAIPLLRPHRQHVARFGSVAIVAAGLFWFVERVL